MKIKNIFFDFDGVLAESLNVKTEAFYQMYLPYGKDVAEKAMKHHIEHGGISRFEKFKLYHKTFLNQEIDEKKVNELANEFSKLVLEGVANSPEIKGAKDFLEANYQSMSFWVISGTPTEELRTIIEKRGMKKYFKDAFGSPEKKDFWSAKILKENNLSNADTLFVGDAMADYDAAMKTNLHFALRTHEDNIELFSKINVLRFKDFTNFEEEIIEKIEPK